MLHSIVKFYRPITWKYTYDSNGVCTSEKPVYDVWVQQYFKSLGQ